MSEKGGKEEEVVRLFRKGRKYIYIVGRVLQKPLVVLQDSNNNH